MYQPGSQLRGLVDDIGQLITTGAQAYKSITAPAIAPFMLPPYQGPNIDPRTGAYQAPPSYYSLPQPTTNYTVPLIIGGGLLLLLFAGRRR